MEPWRVAQIVTIGACEESAEAGAKRALGSGFLVAPGIVLTAAHVLAGAAEVRVRLDVGRPAEICVLADEWWADPAEHNGTDLGFVVIPAEKTAGRDVDPARFGRVSDGTAVLPVSAWGFPRHKLRSSTDSAGQAEIFRDLDDVRARTPVAANRRQGTLAVYLDGPLPAGDRPWEGMSGAAVWADGRIIGVLAEHHSAEGNGRLTARRIDRAYTGLPAQHLDRLVTRLGLPAEANGLPDVIPVEPARLLQSAYLAQVLNIAPDTLAGRENELADWVEFCSGRDGYAWWQGGPWAGKTALAAWFVTHPPDGVDVVSFFVTSRLAGQSDGSAFLDSMTEQLSALNPGVGRSSGARVGEWLSLLDTAARRATERGRRLVVVVDGLDEDQYAASPVRQASIASLLPRRSPHDAVFIVTSRRSPGLPGDVPHDHPLRACVPRQLPESAVAAGVRDLALQELQDLLLDDVGAQVVGYLTGAGGGLAKSDLAELTGVPPYRLEPLLRGVLGRALEARAQGLSPATGPGGEEPAYLLGHDELHSLAVEQLGGDLERYRQGIHAWMQDYAAQGWPAGTPGYAARAYPLLLAAAGDVQRVSALARDPRRHAFLRTVTGDDSTALVEIAKARGLAAAQDVPDLHALVELAVYSDAMALRYQELPVDLPAIWAQLGHLGYAMTLASSFPGPDERTGALVLTIAGAVAASPGDAGRLVGTLDEPDQRAAALGWGAAIAARAGDAAGASRLAAQARILAASADEQFRTQLLDYLEEAARSADGGAVPGRPPGEGGGPDLDRAEAAARAVTEPEPLARRLAGVAVDAAAAGDRDRALRLAPEAAVLARALADSRPQSEVLAQAAMATARAGQPDAAEALAREIVTRRHRAAALSALAQLAVEAGDRTRAARLAADAQAAAQSAINPDHRDQALVYLAAAVAEAGESGVAEDLAAAVTSPRHKARALIELACRTGEPGLVARFVEEAFTVVFEVLDDETEQLRVLRELAFAAAETRVRVYGGTHRDLVERSGDVVESALAEAAVLVARNGDPFYAVQLAEPISGSDGYRVLTAVAVATAETLDPIVAKDIAARIEDDYYRSSALKQVAVAAIQNDSPDDAREIVGELPPKYRAVHSLPVVQEAADRGYLDIAEFVAGTIPETTKYETTEKAEALAVAGHAAGAAGERDRAARLAKRAESLALGISDASTRSYALDRLVAEAARAGDPDRVIALTKVERPDSPAYLSEPPVREALKAGQSDCAEALIRGMAGSGYLSDLKARLLAEVAVHVARQRDLERAARLADEAADLSSPGEFSGGIVAENLAEVRARAGAADAAISLIRSSKWNPDGALAQAAVGAADAGHPDTAEALLECVADADERSLALRKVAVAAARAGSHHDAVRLARIVAARSGDMEYTLAEVAVEIARTGNLEAAQSAAMAVSHPGKRDAALTDVAGCAARRGDLAAARRIFAHAIAGERGDFDPQQGVIFRLETEKPLTEMARFFPAAILDSSGAFLRAYEVDRSPGSARTPTAADDTMGR